MGHWYIEVLKRCTEMECYLAKWGSLLEEVTRNLPEKKKNRRTKTNRRFYSERKPPKVSYLLMHSLFFNDGAVFIWVQVNIRNITKEQYLTNHLRASQSACAKSLFACVVYTKLMWLTLVSFMWSKDTTGYTPNCNNVVIEKSKKQKPNRN